MTTPVQDIRHHLTEGLLAAYAVGSLPEAFSLVVATHVSLCDACRAALAAHEAVGGAVLEGAEQSQVDADSFAATLALIAGMDSSPAPVRSATSPTNHSANPVLPAPLRGYVGGDVENIRWKRIGGGVRQMILDAGPGATARLLHIPAGVAVPDHGHRGTELTLVLQGAFRDETSRFGRGDVEVAGEELEHTPIAEPGEDCICLAATDAPLRFNSLIPRVLQPLLRI